MHPLGGHINKGENTHLGGVDNVFLEVAKVAPAGGTGVHRSGNTGAEHVFFRVDGAQRIRHLVGEHRVDMAVHVDQTWGYDQTGHIHHSLGIRRVQVFAAGSNFAILNGKVTKFHSSGAGVV